MTTPIPVPRGHPAIKLLNSRATDHDSFITHIDRSPVYVKVLVFQITLLFHLLLCGLLMWRAREGTSQSYLLLSLLSGSFLAKRNPTPRSWTWLIIDSIIDVSLYYFIWPRVQAFATGHLRLRLRWGFKATEIVFRKPTGWRRALLIGLPPEEREQQYFNILSRAADPKLVSQNTGYFTHSDLWVLEYNAVEEAYSMMATGELDIKTWDLSVWTRVDGEWHVWEVWRLYDKQTIEAIIDIVMDKLRAMGKEDLIRQWQSIISLDPGAPITTQLGNTTIDLLFQREGVNFEELWVQTVDEAAISRGGKV